MFSVVIATGGPPALLGPTLGSLTPGLVEGMVREVIFADAEGSTETAAIAEAIGARLLPARTGAALAEGVRAAKGPWVMTLAPGARLSADWATALRAHAALRPGQAARFTPPGGIVGRLAAALGRVAGRAGAPAAQAADLARLRAALGPSGDDRALARAFAALRPVTLAARVAPAPRRAGA